jgi:TetR/AcrR family transcriptional regulator, copper-responsive repressor
MKNGFTMRDGSCCPAPAAAARARGRPRSFDRDAALEAAMGVFWQKGYEAASISDLTGAMGINPPSLYAAFGDKERLFLAAVERYLEERRRSCPYAEEPTARESMERLLTYMAHELTEPCHPRGCLMMMAAATTGSASEVVHKALAHERSWGRERIRNRIKRGIEEGDVPRGTDAGALADFYVTIITGMGMQARDGASRKSLLATVGRALQLFPQPPARLGKRKQRAPAA